MARELIFVAPPAGIHICAVPGRHQAQCCQISRLGSVKDNDGDERHRRSGLGQSPGCRKDEMTAILYWHASRKAETTSAMLRALVHSQKKDAFHQ